MVIVIQRTVVNISLWNRFIKTSVSISIDTISYRSEASTSNYTLEMYLKIDWFTYYTRDDVVHKQMVGTLHFNLEEKKEIK